MASAADEGEALAHHTEGAEDVAALSTRTQESVTVRELKTEEETRSQMEMEEKSAVVESSTRQLFLQFSPTAPMSVTRYRITSSGVEGLSYNHC